VFAAAGPVAFAQIPLPIIPPQTETPSTPASPKFSFNADIKELIGNVISGSGNVEVRYGDLILYADYAEINRKTNDVLAVGHVSLIRPGEAFTADRLSFNLDTTLFRGENVVGLVQPQFSYKSSFIERKESDYFSLGKSSITGCAQPVPRWEFSASRANFKRDEYLEMWNFVLSIKKVPILYLPYMKYPLKHDRATGFLMPQIGYSGRKGFMASQQFYLAVARNMDATFSLDYYSTKGVGGGLEYRYLFTDGSGGQLHAYYFMFNTPLVGPKPDNAIMLQWTHNQTLPGRISFVANVDYQNSFSFSREFDNNFMRALVYNRSSQIYLTKSWGGANLSFRLSRFETSFPGGNQSTISQSLPQISFSTFRMKLLGPLHFSLSSTYHRWQYGNTSQYENGTQTKSSEFYLGPVLSAPVDAFPWLNFNFSFAGSLSYYGNSRDLVTRQTVEKGFLSGNYSLSADVTGPVFRRIFTLGESGTKIKHLIKPEFSYRYDSPTIDQDRIITRMGRYFRYHYLIYGLTNHVLVKYGKNTPREVFTWGLAQAFYLDPANSPLSYYPLPDGTIPQFSEISSFLRFFPVAKASLDISTGYNTYKKLLSSVRAAASYGSPADNLHVSLSWFKSVNPYRPSYYDRQQISLSGGARIPRLQLEALGEIDYNIAERKILYTAVSAVWHYQCLDINLNVRAFFYRELPDIQFRLSFGLGNIGQTSDFLGGRGL